MTSSPKPAALNQPALGSIRVLHVHLRTGARRRQAGDSLYGGSGDDTIIAGSADDLIAAQLPEATIVYGSGTATIENAAPISTSRPGPIRR